VADALHRCHRAPEIDGAAHGYTVEEWLPAVYGHAQRFTDTIEGFTGRHVVAFLSQAHVEPDITIEMFFLNDGLGGCLTDEIIRAC
jgi:hypothetical protein